MKLEQSAILFAVLGLVIGGFLGMMIGYQNGKETGCLAPEYCAYTIAAHEGMDDEYLAKQPMPDGEWCPAGPGACLGCMSCLD